MYDVDEKQRKVLILEYGNLPGLIAHWDAHFWHKSQFFFAVKSLLLGAVGVAFRETFLKGVPLGSQGLWVLVGVCIFNYWICYVWFRTNRSNREFLGPLFERARWIEKCLLEGQPGTFIAQWTALLDPKRDRHSAHWWENHLPTVFAVAWTAVLLAGGTTFPPSCEYFWIPWCLVVAVIASVVCVELFHPRRSSRHDLVEAEQDASPDENPSGFRR